MNDGLSPAEGVTRRIAAIGRSISFASLPDPVMTRARHCFLDWLTCTIGGAAEPSARAVREVVLAERGPQQATLVGTGERVAVSQAALVNGTAAHALDLDDVNPGMGHPSAPILPAAVALAERDNVSGARFLAAYVAGHEVHARVARVLTPRHYAAGWHTTSTVGTFGAAAASAHLLGVDAAVWRHALGVAGTQAAGLKSMFGTMTKPFHAGRAAQSGLLAALLAQNGFTSNLDVIECPQGFAATHTDAPSPARAYDDLEFAIGTVLFKRHAACYGTHSTIEGIVALRRDFGFEADRVASVQLRVPPGHLDVCNIAEPATGLEAKFSLRFTAALALAGRDTGPGTFTDDIVHDPVLTMLRDRVSVEADDAARDATAVCVSLDDGRALSASVDVNQPTPDSRLAEEGAALERKFLSVAGPVVGDLRANEILRLVRDLPKAPTIRPILCLTSCDA